MCPFLKKRGNTSKQASDLIENLFINHFREPYLRYFKLQFSKGGISLFFRKKYRRQMFICFLFSWGDCIKPKVKDKWGGTHSNVNLKLFYK